MCRSTPQAMSDVDAEPDVWQPIGKAPVEQPVLVHVRGMDTPVVALMDHEGDWQVAWNGDLITDPVRWARLPPGTEALMA